ncbi:DUF4834 family protein [Sphingobacterium psychroaquaticum]|uniref:DUF4834 domain-containing protein n=1 Tax=Sphingobacterium psychroaquaticum TaxID=561061 RepID=A0A1X7L780_9SPHI|nr:DUF4834 family protein [Sphingobacterium psychroaquaticum]SMG49696.1 protein of unknown function [Sphingobacterium psychroaquaticum]
MEAILKFVIILFAVYYGVKYIFRLLMPFALRKMTERLMQKAQQGASQGRPGSYQYTQNNPFDQFKQQGRKHEGEIKVDYIPEEESKPRKGTQTAGEFVDFEEIK